MKLTFRLLYILTLLLYPTVTTAQISEEGLPTAELQPFTSIRVEADIDLTLIEIEANDSCRLVYDLEDNDPEKFKFSVSDKGRLTISQSRNTKSVSPVRATLYYQGVDNISVARATVRLGTPLSTSMADIRVEEDGRLYGELQCDDVQFWALTDCRVELTGAVRYFTLRSTTSAKSNLKGVDIVSARIDVSHGAIVAVTSGERLDISASTKAVVKYWGEPKILRVSQGLIGGEVTQQD